MVDLKVLQFVSTVSNDVTKDTMSSLFDVTGKFLSRQCQMIFERIMSGFHSANFSQDRIMT